MNNGIDFNQISEKLELIGCKQAIDNPKISIIVPTYNNEKYISKCLFSLIEQTLKEIEIIVVNDGSFDDTEKILNLFEKYDLRIKVINQPNKKQGSARNTGTKIAKGEYIGFVDSDDWIDKDYYEKLYNSAKKYNSDIALATNVRIGNGKTKKRINITEEKFVSDMQSKFDVGNHAKNPCPTNKIYKKELLEKNNIVWPEGVFCEDKLFTIQAVYYANGIVTVPDTYYYYFRNPNSTVKNSKKHHIKKAKEDKELAHYNVLKFLKDKNANIRDKDFWAITKKIRFMDFVFLTRKESLNTVRYYLFGLIKIFEKPIKKTA